MTRHIFYVRAISRPSGTTNAFVATQNTENAKLEDVAIDIPMPLDLSACFGQHSPVGDAAFIFPPRSVFERPRLSNYDIGERPDREALEKLARELHIDACIHLRGYVSNEQLKEGLMDAVALVFPPTVCGR